MSTYYKLTDENGQAHNATQWGPGVRHEARGPNDGPLCSDSWIHLYTDPLLAVLLNPIHASFSSPLLWEAEIEGEPKTDHGLKVGARAVTTIKTIPLPEVSTEQRIRFAILCALKVYAEPSFVAWAEGWLHHNTNRSARAAARAAAWAARVAAWAAAEAAAWAAARAAAWAAEAAAAAEARAAAEAAAWAADRAAEAACVDLLSLARQAMEGEQP